MEQYRKGFPSYMFDLTEWFADAHVGGGLPKLYAQKTLAQIYHDLGLFSWIVGETSCGSQVKELSSGSSVQPVYVLIEELNLDAPADRDRIEALLGRIEEISRGVHQRGGLLFVKVRGRSGALLGEIAEAGADCIEGVCCPPRGGAMLMKARDYAGPEVLLWGGLPGEMFLDSWDAQSFMKITRYVAEEACCEPNVIIGAAGGVPPGADIERVRYAADICMHLEEL